MHNATVVVSWHEKHEKSSRNQVPTYNARSSAIIPITFVRIRSETEGITNFAHTTCSQGIRKAVHFAENQQRERDPSRSNPTVGSGASGSKRLLISMPIDQGAPVATERRLPTLVIELSLPHIFLLSRNTNRSSISSSYSDSILIRPRLSAIHTFVKADLFVGVSASCKDLFYIMQSPLLDTFPVIRKLYRSIGDPRVSERLLPCFREGRDGGLKPYKQLIDEWR